MTHEALIAKLEAQKVGGRLLDCEIWWSIDRRAAERAYWAAALGMPRPLPDQWSKVPRGLGVTSMKVHCPHYTTSTEVALTLIDLNAINVSIRIWNDGRRQVRLFDNGPISLAVDAATAPLALCIAGLKVRSAA